MRDVREVLNFCKEIYQLCHRNKKTLNQLKKEWILMILNFLLIVQQLEKRDFFIRSR